MGCLRCTRCGKAMGIKPDPCRCKKVPPCFRMAPLVVNVPFGCAFAYREVKDEGYEKYREWEEKHLG